MRWLRCKHRRLSVPINGHRSCTLCGAEFPYTVLELTEQDKEQAARVDYPHDASNLRRKPTDSVVRSITRRQEKK